MLDKPLSNELFPWPSFHFIIIELGLTKLLTGLPCNSFCSLTIPWNSDSPAFISQIAGGTGLSHWAQWILLPNKHRIKKNLKILDGCGGAGLWSQHFKGGERGMLASKPAWATWDPFSKQTTKIQVKNLEESQVVFRWCWRDILEYLVFKDHLMLNHCKVPEWIHQYQICSQSQ